MFEAYVAWSSVGCEAQKKVSTEQLDKMCGQDVVWLLGRAPRVKGKA